MTALDASQLKALVDHAPSLVWRSSVDGEHDYFNATWLAYTGRSLAQELGRGWTASLHGDDSAACLAAQRRSFALREPFELEYRMRRHDGVYRSVIDRAVPYVDAEGAFAGFCGNCVDIEERRARDESYGINDFFDMALDNLCVVGYDGYFKRLNRSWTSTLGWSRDELMARPSEEFLHPDDRANTLSGRQRLQSGTELGPLTNRYRCKDGSYRWFEWRSVAHADRGLVYASARDITEQKHAAEQLDQAERAQQGLQAQLILADRMASVGTLAAGIAHEINNPLTYVIGNLSVMRDVLAPDGAVSTVPSLAALHQQAMDAHDGAERIRKIVRSLKTFSRAEEERRVLVDVRDLLDLSVDTTWNELRHRARLVKDYGAIPHVEADDARLGQVFINLLINAAQAIDESARSEHEVRLVTCTDQAGNAVIEVRDSGGGMSESVQGRVFDPFYTTKPVGMGTGLGLSICHSIVTGLGGTLSVSSELGRGSSFRIVLPAAPVQPRAARAQPSHAPVELEASLVVGSVLIVDDEPSIGSILSRVLREHAVTFVTSARQALQLIAEGAQFDVILSDLMMPELSGMDFYDELQRRDPATAARVVFISGGAFTPIASKFLERVRSEYMEKPFDARAIRALVQRRVRQAQHAGSAVGS